MTSLISSLKQALSTDKRIEQPTYSQDIVGEINQWDERDIVFARNDLFEYFDGESLEREAYYEAHPDLLDYDSKLHAMPGLGRTGGVDIPMFITQFDVCELVGTEDIVDGRTASRQAQIPPERAAKKVKSFADVLGADLVRIGPLRQEWVYSHVGRTKGNRQGYGKWGAPIDLSHHHTAIALGFQMDYDLIQCAPDFPLIVATGKGYATGSWISVQLAQYIRRLGYSARAHHLSNYQLLCVPVAVDCGLGELSRAGFLKTREFGLGLRLAVVTTDLPLTHDRPVDIGIQSFCENCNICAEECPIGAIPEGDKVEYNGVEKWKLDEKKCYRYWHAAGSDCGICMAACPWTKPQNWLHKSLTTLATIKGPHQALMVQGEKLFYGKFKGKPRPDFIDSPKKHDRG
jgi:ferredoxin